MDPWVSLTLGAGTDVLVHEQELDLFLSHTK